MVVSDFIYECTISEDLCDRLIACTKNWNEDTCVSGSVGFRDDTAREKVQDWYFPSLIMRNKEDGINIGGEQMSVNVAYGGLDRVQVLQEFSGEIWRHIKDYCSKYDILWSMRYLEEWDLSRISHIQYYAPSSSYFVWHQENGCDLTRVLTWMTYLNTVDDPDDEYGGGTAFYFQDKKEKAIKGKTLIWPADWTHHHRGIVSHTQEKYIITGWGEFIKNEDKTNKA